MSIQYEHATQFVDSKDENPHDLLLDCVENKGGDGEIIELPLEAMVISNSSLCAFMGARSPWANT